MSLSLQKMVSPCYSLLSCKNGSEYSVSCAAFITLPTLRCEELSFQTNCNLFCAKPYRRYVAGLWGQGCGRIPAFHFPINELFSGF